MKRLSLSYATLLAGLVTPILPAIAQNTSPRETQTPATPSVVISEVCYWPKEGEPEWIELSNISDKPIDIKGWQLVDGQTLDFVVSAASLVMPPQSYLVVRLDGTGQPAAPFAQNKAIAHSPRDIKGNLLGDKGGQVALYSQQVDQYQPSEIRSYVAWGRSPGRVISDAMKMGYWSMPGQLPDDIVVGTSSELNASPIKTIRQGGTIALLKSLDKGGYAYENWGVFSPNEVSMGQESAKRGVTLGFPPNGWKSDGADGIFSLRVARMKEDVKYHFQVCTDKECQHIFLDALEDQPNYTFEKPIPRHSTYYWRVQLVYPDGYSSAWSEIRSITYGYPK